jgi:hypothetical protein
LNHEEHEGKNPVIPDAAQRRSGIQHFGMMTRAKNWIPGSALRAAPE